MKKEKQIASATKIKEQNKTKREMIISSMMKGINCLSSDELNRLYAILNVSVPQFFIRSGVEQVITGYDDNEEKKLLRYINKAKSIK